MLEKMCNSSTKKCQKILEKKNNVDLKTPQSRSREVVVMF